MTAKTYTCREDGDGTNETCGLPATWLHCGQFSGDIPYCDKHALAQPDFGHNDSHWVWERLGATPPANVFKMTVDKPFSVTQFMHAGHAAGHDALGIANDPEALAALDAAKANTPINHHTRAPHQPTHAVIVEGAYDPSVLSKIAYEIRLIRNGPGAVELRFTLNGMAYGSLPFDNLVKAATRIDPDHAAGAELQIQKLRRETADARAAMYDWRARAEQAEAKLAAFTEAAKA